jgi:hypothetical protein
MVHLVYSSDTHQMVFVLSRLEILKGVQGPLTRWGLEPEILYQQEPQRIIVPSCWSS